MEICVFIKINLFHYSIIIGSLNENKMSLPYCLYLNNAKFKLIVFFALSLYLDTVWVPDISQMESQLKKNF